MMRQTLMLVAFGAAALTACGDSTTNLSGDADGATEADTTLDVEDGDEAETAPDVAADADIGTDADADPDADSSADAEAEAETEAEAEAEADGGPTGAPIGAPCAAADDCLDGAVPAECLRESFGAAWPDGYCSAIGCRDDAECPGGPPGAICVGTGGGMPLCFATCDSALDDCRTGYHCLDPDGPGLLAGVCLPACRDDGDCAAGETCDTGDGLPVCRSTAGAANGGACVTLADCASGSGCHPESETTGMSGWPGGLCTQGCQADADCTNGGVCALNCSDENRTRGDDCDDDGVAGPDESGVEGQCLAACDPADAGACPRDGYTCRAVGENFGGAVNACAPDCSEAGGGCTVAGNVCDPAGGALGGDAWGLGRCQPPFDPALLGGPCSVTGGCTGGTCMAELFSGFPHGNCVEECIAGPGGDPCPGTSLCLAPPGEPGWCADLCSPSSPSCRDGYECRLVGGGAAWICLPGCTDNAQCEFECCDAAGSGACDPSRTRCL
ncbi:MAG: hypothetical protein HY907_13420 [Deltaproteobacteria bacterium]|nr:hypothetical protein [Deltaproteobacteria bacterium]